MLEDMQHALQKWTGDPIGVTSAMPKVKDEAVPIPNEQTDFSNTVEGHDNTAWSTSSPASTNDLSPQQQPPLPNVDPEPVTPSKPLKDLLESVMYRGDGKSQSFAEEIRLWQPQKSMLFLWQYPMMLMAYSWVFFVTALSLHVTKPLIAGHRWNDDSKVNTLARCTKHDSNMLMTAQVAIFYLAFLGPCFCFFFWSAAARHFQEDLVPLAKVSTPSKDVV